MNRKVLIAIINNRNDVPMYFCQNLFELIEYTKFNKMKVAVRSFSSVEVQQMRNLACIFSIKNNFDYIFMLDTDMKYPKDSIVKLIKHDKEIVVGSATQRKYPFYPTQYKKLGIENFKSKSNRIFISKENKKLIKIEFSGVVGALIKTKILKRLTLPYFKVGYKSNGIDVIGSDIYFCKKLKEKKIKMYLDPTINYSHEVLSFSNSFGLDVNN